MFRWPQGVSLETLHEDWETKAFFFLKSCYEARMASWLHSVFFSLRYINRIPFKFFPSSCFVIDCIECIHLGTIRYQDWSLLYSVFRLSTRGVDSLKKELTLTFL
jgi:hypothetical protein